MLYKYYMLHRPVGIGAQPMNGFVDFENYEQKTFIGEIGREAWGSVLYNRKLTDAEVKNYEMMRGEEK